MATYYLPSYFTASGLGATGLTVTVDVHRLSDNTEVVTAGVATEIGDGGYFYSFTGQVDNYFYVFKTVDANVDQLQIAGFTALQLMNIDAVLEDTGTTIPGLLGSLGGSLSLTYTVNDSVGDPIEGALVKIYSDSDRNTLITSKVTNVLGQVTFTNLVAGTYYLKTQLTGFEDMLDSEVVA